MERSNQNQPAYQGLNTDSQNIRYQISLIQQQFRELQTDQPTSNQNQLPSFQPMININQMADPQQRRPRNHSSRRRNTKPCNWKSKCRKKGKGCPFDHECKYGAECKFKATCEYDHPVQQFQPGATNIPLLDNIIIQQQLYGQNEYNSDIEETYFYLDFLKKKFMLDQDLYMLQMQHPGLSFDSTINNKLQMKIKKYLYNEEIQIKIEKLLIKTEYIKKDLTLDNFKWLEKRVQAELSIELQSINHKYSLFYKNQNQKQFSKTATIIISYQNQNEEIGSKIIKTFKNLMTNELQRQWHLLLNSKKMTFKILYPKYVFLKKEKILEDIAKSRGLNQKIFYDDKQCFIKAQLTEKQFQSIKPQLEEKLGNLQAQQINVNSYFVPQFTMLYDGSTLKEKIESKFKVQFNGDVQSINIGQYKGKPKFQYQFENQNKPISDIKFNSIITLVGFQVEQAIQYLNSKLAKYTCISVALGSPPLEMLVQLKNFEFENKVVTDFRQGKIYVLGKSIQTIQKYLQCFNQILQQGKQQYETVQEKIPFPSYEEHLYFRCFQEKGDQIKIVEQQTKAKITILKKEIIITGSRSNVTQAKQLIEIIFSQIKSRIIRKPIDGIHLKALRKSNERDLQIKYCVNIKRINIDIEIQQQNPQDKKLIREKEFPQWSYKVNSVDSNFAQRTDQVNNWFNYDPDQNWQIEMHYQQCCKEKKFNQKMAIVGDQNLAKNGKIYEINGLSEDPNTWSQINTETKYVRKLNRIIVRKQIIEEEEEEKVPQIQSQHLSQNTEIKYYVIGLQYNVEKLFKYLDEYSKDPKNFVEFIFIKQQIDQISQKELQNLIQQKYECTIEFNQQPKIKIGGFKSKDAKIFLLDTLEKMKKISFPINWEDTLNLLLSKNGQLIKDVKMGTPEWNEIESALKKTVPSANVKKIERIQDRRIWKLFKTEEENLKDMYEVEPQTKRLFHGTRGAAPQLIYMSEKGFDMRYSQSGMWGIATYFAVNASYSNSGYAFTTPQGDKQLFYANVLTGLHKELPPTNTLRMPPFMEGSTEKRYHSVKGFTGGSDVFMIYDNGRAYPEYLITYKD